MLKNRLNITDGLNNLASKMGPSIAVMLRRNIPYGDGFFFLRILPIANAIVLWEGNASTQWWNMNINTSTHLYAQDDGNWIKSICHTSKGPEVNGNWPLEEFVGLPGLCIGQRWHFRHIFYFVGWLPIVLLSP